MAKKKAQNMDFYPSNFKSLSARKKKRSASPPKKKLGDASLEWITDTTEGEEILSEQAESPKSESPGKSKEKKIGLLKQYVSKEAEKKEFETTEKTPVIFGISSAITKGGKKAQTKENKIKKTEVLKEEKTTPEKEDSPASDDFVEVAEEKKDDIPVEEMDKGSETKQEVKAGEVKKSVEEDKEKTISAEEASIEIGKTYKITEEKELVPVEEEEKTIPDKEEATPDAVEPPTEYEVKREDVAIEEETKIEEPAVYIPEDSSSILKKKAAAKKEKIEKKEKAAPKKKKAEKIEIEAIPQEEREKSRTSKMIASFKKGGRKVSQKIAQPFKVAKPRIKKTVSAAIDVSKHPVKTLSSIDKKITKSMKKITFIGNSRSANKSIIKNIKETNSKITKSAKKLIDSILD